MKPSQKYRLDRLARELSRPQGWLDEDPPTWDWKLDPSLGFQRYVARLVRPYGLRRLDIAGNALASRLRRTGD